MRRADAFISLAAVVAAAAGVAVLASAPPGVFGIAPATSSAHRPFDPNAGPTPGTTAGPGWNLAAEEIQNLGWSGLYRGSFAGLRMGDPGELTVYRLENAAFDDAVARIADRFRVRAHLRGAEISYAQMKSLSAEIDRRRDALRARGAPVTGVAIKPEGRVLVMVAGDPAVARDVLKDLRHVEFEYGAAGVPL